MKTMEPEPLTKVAQFSDCELLYRIATLKDQSALNELLTRHERGFFSLALQVTQDPELAAEAVQDAAYQIWRSAALFRSPGNPRAWMLRILVRTGAHLARKSRLRKGLLVQIPPDLAEMGRPEPNPEGQELVACLRTELSTLPKLDQQMVTLYFAGGISHQEIGKVLGIPQRTVSHRIGLVVHQLRNRLSRAGFHKALVPLESEGLIQALCAGPALPAGLHASIMAGLSRPGGRLGQGRPWSKISANGFIAMALLAGVSAMVLLSLAIASRSGPLEFPSGALGGSTQGSPETQAAALWQSPTNSEGRIVRAWDFNAPVQDEEIRVVQGSWRWLKTGGPDGSGCYETSRLFLAEVPIPPSKSYHLAVNYQDYPLGQAPDVGFLTRARWSGHRWIGRLYNIGKPVLLAPNSWFRISSTLTEEYEDNLTNGERTNFAVCARTPNAVPLLICREACRIDNLSLREIGAEDLPAGAETLLKAVRDLPSWPSSGSVVIPGLPSAKPGQPVHCTFFGQVPPSPSAPAGSAASRPASED